MSITVRVRNVSPHALEIRPRFDEPGIAVVEAGAEVEVAAALAGREPGEWEPADARADDGRAYRVVVDADGVEHLEARDAGAGLLAQVDNFVRATPPRATTQGSVPPSEKTEA